MTCIDGIAGTLFKTLPYIGVLVGSLVFSLVLTPLVRRINSRLGMVDIPGGRRINKRPIARGGGVAVIVETMTDSRNRTAGNMRHHFDKFGGNLGASGCVAWSFDKKGVLVIDNEDGDYDEEEVMMDAMDAGADDFEADGDVFTIYTLPDEFNDVVANLSKYTFVSAQIEMVPQNYQKLDSEDQIKQMEKLIDAMEDDDDVQNVWHNWEE